MKHFDSDDVRWIFFHRPDLVESISIGRVERLALAIIQTNGSVDSRKLFDVMGGKNLRGVSTLLKKLYDKKYLTRVEKADKSGGIFYEYSLADCVKYGE